MKKILILLVLLVFITARVPAAPKMVELPPNSIVVSVDDIEA